ncbi:MAG TPA: GAF domain-containing protein [Anaerolineae bacterium]|nr:GAF domain-containing protein [Anaerolineae bacterium]
MKEPRTEEPITAAPKDGWLAATARARAAYDWEAAVSVCSQGLEQPGLPPEVTYALLDTLSQAHQMLGDLASQEIDLEAMARLATELGDPRREGQVIMRRADLLGRRGRAPEARRLAQSALDSARLRGDRSLEAAALTALSCVDGLWGSYDSARERGERALELFRSLGDPLGEAQALWWLSMANTRQERNAEAIDQTETALGLYRLVGDRDGEARCLNALGISNPDVGQRRALYEQALAAFGAIGNRPRQAQMHNNLALANMQMGLYALAREDAANAVATARRIGARVDLAYYLDTLARVCMALNEAAESEALGQEGLSLSREVGDQGVEGSYLIGLGRAALAAGRLLEAAELLREAAGLYERMGVPAEQATCLAWLGAVCLELGDVEAAQMHTSRAADLIASIDSGATEYPPQEVWWWHYRALAASLPLAEGNGGKSDAAWRALDQALQQVLIPIANLTDDGLRRNYLNKVAINRQIVVEWLRQASARGLPLHPLTGALASPSAGQEQFRRMLDIGLRLNARHETGDLARFVVNQVVELTGAEQVLLYRLDDAGNRRLAAEFWADGAPPSEGGAGDEAERLIAEVALKRVALLLHIPPDVPQLDQRSQLCVPLMAAGKLVGLVYAGMAGTFGRFTERDRDLLSVLANQAAVALENAQWTETLERRVQGRTSELQTANAQLSERTAELEIISSVQRLLAAQLNMQAIYDVVGDKIRDIFDAQVVSIATYDHALRVVRERYAFEGGGRVPVFEPFAFDDEGVNGYLIRTRRPLLLNENVVQRAEEYGMITVPGTQEPRSLLTVPLIAGEVVTGYISLQNLDREHAFSESDVRLLTTLAGSMSVALENARLFDETSRLLAETRQRTAELEIISSIQQGLAAKLDEHAIYDLVGDKIGEVFDAQAVTITTYDHAARLNSMRYCVERGQRAHDETPYPSSRLADHLTATRLPVLINESAPEHMAEVGMWVVPGTEAPKSLLFVPMVAGNEVRGALSLQNLDREHAFRESDVRLLTTLAGSMSVALDNARLFAETKRLLAETQQRTSELETINRVGTALARQLDAGAIIRLVGEKAQDIFGADAVNVLLYDAATGMIQDAYSYDRGDTTTGEPFPLGKGLTSSVIRSRKPLLLGTDEEQTAYGTLPWYGGAPRKEPTQSYMGVPVVVGERVIGVVSVQSYRQHAYGEAGVQLLSTLTSSMGVALENARLFAETNRLLEESRQRAGELSTVNRIGQALASQLDLDTLIHLVGEQIRNAFHANFCYVALLDQQAEMIHFPYQFGESYSSLPLGQGLTSRILQSGEPLLLNQDVAGRRAEMGIQRVGLESKSYLGVPIMVSQEAIGVLSVQSTEEEGRFDEDDLRLLTTVAGTVGAALQNARLYQETQRRAAEMAALAEVGRQISATLDLPVVLERITGQARELLSGALCAVYLLQRDGCTLKAIAASGEAVEAVLADESLLGQGIIGSIVQNGAAERVDDTAVDPRGLHIPGTGDAETGEKLMVAPLLVQARAIGALAVWRDPGAPLFNEAELAFAIGLAQQAAVAIANARLFEAAQESQRRMADIIDFLPDATLVIDRDGRVIAWNRAIEEMTGVAAHDILGRANYEHALPFYGERRPILIDLVLLPDEEIEQRYAYLQRHGAALTGEALVPQLRGSPAYLYATASALRNSKGEVVGAIETIRDISDRKRAEEELHQAKAAAESATQAKSAFLATMSHEIRTPMNAVIGMTSLLLDTPLTAEQRDFAETIRTSGDALLTIINDILDFSKIEAGRLDLESSPFDLRECIEGALDLLAPKAREKDLNLAYLVEPGVPAAIVGDVTRLRQVLVNLLSNAVKFTEQGEVVVTVTAGSGSEAIPCHPEATSEETRPLMHFSVRDTGVGIPPDRMDRLFQSFSQVDSSTTRKYGGTGLGLAISQRLTEMMGGIMWAESSGVAGEGSTFHFTVRAEPAALPARAELRADAADLRGRRVLIVDDNATNRRILALQTRGWGMTPRDTGSASEALAWLRAGDVYDIALVDRQMPEMDGIALAGEIRRLAPQVPVVMVSSLGQREAAADAAPVGAFLLKPIKASQLYDALAGLLASRPGTGAKPQAVASQFDAEMGERHPLRILLAEDNAVNQKLALRLLERLGYRADLAANGVEAIRALERQRYDLIFMDIQMPEMDGLDATRQICERWAEGERPRIVAMTANALAEDREACLAAGMDDYLAKPIRVEELVAALSRTWHPDTRP